jgi:hypothetical protein
MFRVQQLPLPFFSFFRRKKKKKAKGLKISNRRLEDIEKEIRVSSPI